jgi:DNA mismatch repair ATPase MutS
MALEKWKRNNANHVEKWFSTLAQMELLSSLGTLYNNHPHWSFPVITTSPSVLKAEGMGHPLIPAERMKTNTIIITQGQQLCLITGSNMAGKSTFLRSTGVNIVLAMMGAPVNAQQFTLSPMQVLSSMRVTDNLEESTSTFYAELKKLKEVINAVNNHQKVFLLLDEILRGTNSADRHTGSKALIKQLVQQNATGMLATHDIALAKLADAYPTHIRNYHFDVRVNGDELYFDYQLKEGVCTSMNASILMKKIGIELGEDQDRKQD